MLIEPSQKYTDYIYYSSHYLNCPKHMLNYQLRSIIQLCYGHYDMAEKRIFEAKRYYKLLIPSVKKLIEYHWSTKESEFNKLNINSYIDNPPKHIIIRNQFITNWNATKTQEVWRCGHLVNIIYPPSPFKDK